MTNKFQLQITKNGSINRFKVWLLLFYDYLRFEICDLLFGAVASLRLNKN